MALLGCGISRGMAGCSSLSRSGFPACLKRTCTKRRGCGPWAAAAEGKVEAESDAEPPRLLHELVSGDTR